MIAALAKNRVIGRANRLPWHLPADLKRFKAVTLGHPVIMGRKTHESIGKPLPGRANIVVSRNPAYAASGCTVAASLADAVAHCASDGEIFVIGGGELYRQALALADRLYLTEIDAEFDGDARFPEYNPGLWHEASREAHPADNEVPFRFDFVIYDRKT